MHCSPKVESDNLSASSGPSPDKGCCSPRGLLLKPPRPVLQASSRVSGSGSLTHRERAYSSPMSFSNPPAWESVSPVGTQMTRSTLVLVLGELWLSSLSYEIIACLMAVTHLCEVFKKLKFCQFFTIKKKKKKGVLRMEGGRGVRDIHSTNPWVSDLPPGTRLYCRLQITKQLTLWLVSFKKDLIM